MKIILTLGFLFTVFILVYWWKRRHLIKLAARIPGPLALPMIGNIYQFHLTDFSKNFRIFLHFMERYGSVVRIWFGPALTIMLTDPEDIKKVVQHDNYCTRGYMPSTILKQIFRNGLLAIDGKIWLTHRKIVSSAFQTNLLISYTEKFAIHSNILCKRLERLTDGKYVDLFTPFAQCTLDILCDTIFDYKLDMQANNRIEPIKCLLNIIDYFFKPLIQPWLLLPWFKQLFKAQRVHEADVKYMHSIIETGIFEKIKLYEEAMSAGKNIDFDSGYPNLLYKMLANPEFDNDDVIGEVSSITGAGTETTATTSCFVLALLCEHRDIEEKVLDEQRRIFKSDFHRPVTSDDLILMVYLEQVIKETLRLYPPLPFHYRELTKDLDLGNGYVLPVGCTVLSSVYLIHRNVNYYAEPNKFDPDRFSPENFVGLHPYAYIPFGLGRRFCVGHNYAMMDIKTILSTFLRRYRVCGIDGGMNELEKNFKFGLSLKNPAGFKFSLESRCTDSET